MSGRRPWGWWCYPDVGLGVLVRADRPQPGSAAASLGPLYGSMLRALLHESEQDVWKSRPVPPPEAAVREEDLPEQVRQVVARMPPGLTLQRAAADSTLVLGWMEMDRWPELVLVAVVR